MNEEELKAHNKEYHSLIRDVQKEYTRLNRFKDKIILVLIICMLIEAVVFYGGFIWYESQFEIKETTTETETLDTTYDIDLNTQGENANIDYNNVEGNQYNDNATHNETKGGD